MKLNMDIIKTKNLKAVSAKEALKDVVPIKWSDKVLSGQKKVKVSHDTDNL